MSIIKNITNINDIRNLNDNELELLTDEVRKIIISTVLSNGGHLSSNLGVVELTIALLRKLNLDQDVLVFDVGHQSYTYKLLTGRLDNFHTLRQKNGLSGFPKREESSYDFFNTGHASTSLSAAEGLYKSSKLLNKESYIVAVIGDGALTGGMCWEAMNNLVNGNDNVIIILNDNGMSIDKNIGALDQLLSDLRVRPQYLYLKENSEKILNRTPIIGKVVKKFLITLKSLLRKKIQPNSIFFEEFGIKYYGPIDGHNIKMIEENLEAAKSHSGPVLLHVCTTKGKGYELAEKEPSDYHGVSPKKKLIEDPIIEVEVSEIYASSNDEDQKYSTINFFKKENSSIKNYNKLALVNDENLLEKKLKKAGSFTEAFSVCIEFLAYKNDKLVAITAAMKKGTGLSEFAEKFPSRFFDVGIAEQHAVTMAAGIAAGGLLPVVCIYSTFLQRALDQVLHDVCLQNLKLIFAVDRAGVVGEDGETHQGVYDIFFVNNLPNIDIFSPSDSKSLYSLLNYAITNSTKSIMIRYPRGEVRYDIVSEYKQLADELNINILQDDDLYIKELWRVENKKSKVCVICNSSISYNLLEVMKKIEANKLKQVNIYCFEKLNNINYEKLTSIVQEFERIIVFEELIDPGIIYPQVIDVINLLSLGKKVIKVNLGREVINQGKSREILEEHNLCGEALKEVLLENLEDL